MQMERCAKAAPETHTPAQVMGTMHLDSIFCQAMKACMGTSILGDKFQGGLPKSNTFLAYTWHYLAKRVRDIQHFVPENINSKRFTQILFVLLSFVMMGELWHDIFLLMGNFHLLCTVK